MDLVIYATKDGLRTLYSTNDDIAYLIAEEKRSGASKDSSLGGFVYGLSFIESGFVFTKYLIVKDTLRSNALGFIAFSLHINQNKTIKGTEVKYILDKLSVDYTNAYIKDNYLNRSEKKLIREDWGFVKAILSEYKEQDRNRIEELIECGAKDPAHIYYKNEAELFEYFDKPFQEEYGDFKQIYFIANDLKDNDKNPLNVLINSGIELKDIDLKNEYFYLNNYNRSKGIIIIANGKERSDGKNNNSIRAKWPVEIKYSKDDRCFWPIRAIGTLSNPDSEIFKYLELKGNQVLIKWDAFSNPEPKSKSITFIVKNFGGEFINDAEIQIGTKPKFNVTDYKFTYEFKGEDIIRKSSISFNKENFKKTIYDFIPELAREIVEIKLDEHKLISIEIKDLITSSKIEGFQVWTKLTNGYKTTNELEYINEQIDDKYDITIRKNGYEDTIINDFIPRNSFKIESYLKEKQKIQLESKQYKIDAGEHGKKTGDCPGYSNFSNGSDLNRNVIKAKSGWKFIGWKLDDSKNTLIAQYEKVSIVKKPVFVISLIASIAIIGFCAWLIFKTDNTSENKEPLSFSQIKNYIEGDSLLLDKLNTFKRDFEHQKPSVIEKNNGLTDWIIGKKKSLDSTELMAWREKLKIIDEAIFKREFVNNKEFKELLNSKYSYSNMQQPFFEAIKKIDTLQYDEIKRKLGNVDDKTLSEIVDILNKIKSEEKSPKINDDNKRDKLAQQSDDKSSPTKAQTNKLNQTSNTSENTNNEISSKANNEILISKLKGNSITIPELETYKNENKKFINSIDLYINFLKYLHEGNNQKEDYDKLLKKVKEDSLLKNSDLKRYLDQICTNSESFQKFNSITGKGTIKTLKELQKKPHNEGN
ncbi:hypothetical protein [Flavobacterium sp.]|uniref:hypothetical protein n=1 Tax=Flavobacterium sp. TaxID=239 RepID=UPI002FD87F56